MKKQKWILLACFCYSEIMSKINPNHHQERSEAVIAENLTRLMIIAMETKNENIADTVEQIGQVLEQLGFFQTQASVFLPFSTTLYGALLSDYIKDKQSGIVGLKDVGEYNTETKWGIPGIFDLEDHAIELRSIHPMMEYIESQDFEEETRQDKKKAKKYQEEKLSKD